MKSAPVIVCDEYIEHSVQNVENNIYIGRKWGMSENVSNVG